MTSKYVHLRTIPQINPNLSFSQASLWGQVQVPADYLSLNPQPPQIWQQLAILAHTRGVRAQGCARHAAHRVEHFTDTILCPVRDSNNIPLLDIEYYVQIGREIPGNRRLLDLRH
jgi:hypothetical protein